VVTEDILQDERYSKIAKETREQKKSGKVPKFGADDYSREAINKRLNWLEQKIGKSLHKIGGCSVDPAEFKGNIENLIGTAQIPIGIAGPLKVKGQYAEGEYFVPMATTEGVLILTYEMGMKLLAISGGASTQILSNKVHISPFFVVNPGEEKKLSGFLASNRSEIIRIAESTSHHLRVLDIEAHLIDNNFIVKFIYNTGDAQGLNMINNATLAACNYIKEKISLNFFLRSHYSGVKHFSTLNYQTGYGRKVIASATIPQKILKRLRVNAIQLRDFFNACTKAGHQAGISAVNVHASNAIAAIFAACGQDLADISSSHVCSSYCEVVNSGNDFYLQSTLHNLLIGTVGGGTGKGTQRECLEIMDCYGSGKSDKLAEIIAATVLAGELITAAAVVNGTYVDAHNKYGRNKPKE